MAHKKKTKLTPEEMRRNAQSKIRKINKELKTATDAHQKYLHLRLKYWQNFL
jgi:hypothetical protein